LKKVIVFLLLGSACSYTKGTGDYTNSDPLIVQSVVQSDSEDSMIIHSDFSSEDEQKSFKEDSFKAFTIYIDSKKTREAEVDFMQSLINFFSGLCGLSRQKERKSDFFSLAQKLGGSLTKEGSNFFSITTDEKKTLEDIQKKVQQQNCGFLVSRIEGSTDNSNSPRALVMTDYKKLKKD